MAIPEKTGKCEVESIIRLKLFRMTEGRANKCHKGREQERGGAGHQNKGKKSGHEHYEEEREAQDAGQRTGLAGESIGCTSLMAGIQSPDPSVQGWMERTES